MESLPPDGSPEALRQRLLAPPEREQIVRLCYRLTGDRDVAEDLAQDTLLLAWRQADTLRNPDAWRPWVFGIARNLYLRWHRSHYRDQARRTPLLLPQQTSTDVLEAQIDPNADDWDTILERQEITHLLSKALSALPNEAREMLVDYYVEELPQAEIALKHGISENTAAVRLHRGKRTLKKILTTSDLRHEAAAYGLIPPEAETWQETRIWCPFCGKAYLQGRVFYDMARHFKMQCPQCSFVMGPRVSDYPSDCIFAHHAFDASRVIEGVRGYKPALNRLRLWWDHYFQDGLRRGRVTCIGCGQPLTLSSEKPGHLPRQYTWRGLHIACEKCSKIHVLLPAAFTLISPAVQEFWRKHPRIRHLPPCSLSSENGILMRIESVTDHARLDLVLSRTDCRIVQVEER